MLRSLYTAYTGMVNEQRRMDIMTNNLANATTAGFKMESSSSQSFDRVLGIKIRDVSEAFNDHTRRVRSEILPENMIWHFQVKVFLP